jgi:hypothetical protein
MARRKVREYVEEVPPDTVGAAVNAELAEQQIPEAEIDEIFRMTDELRSTAGIVCQILRKLPPHLAGYCGEITPGEFSLERVRKTYGPGKYAVRLKGPLGYVKGGGTLDIAPLPEGTPVAAHESRDSAAAIIEALDKRSEARGSELKSWAQILAPLLIPVVGSWLKPRENQVSELVQGLAALKGLTPDPPKPEGLEAQLDRILGVMDKLKEAKGGEPSTGATWVDIVRDGISALKGPAEALAGRLMTPGVPMLPPLPMITHPTPQGPTSVAPSSLSQSPNAGGAAPASSAPGAPGATAPSNGGNTPVGVVSFLPWLRDNLQALIYQAGRNKDPGLYASVMLDNLPPGTDPALLKGFIERADWWAQLQQFAPGVTPYPAWFEEFREAVLEILNSPPEEERTPEPPAAGPTDGDQEPFA